VKKIILVIVLFSAITLTLYGCSINNGKGDKKEEPQLLFWEKVKQKEQTVWFFVDDLKKDGVVSHAYVTKNGHFTKYDLGSSSSENVTKPVTLSDFDKKNENETLALIKKMDKNNYDNKIQSYKEEIENQQEFIVAKNEQQNGTNNQLAKEVIQKDISQSQVQIEQLKTFINESHYSIRNSQKIEKIDLITDDSGNNITPEKIISNHDSEDSRNQMPYTVIPTTSSSDLNTKTTFTFKSTVSPKEILSGFYAGYATSLNAKDNPSGPYLVTKVKDTTTTVHFDNGDDPILSKE